MRILIITVSVLTVLIAGIVIFLGFNGLFINPVAKEQVMGPYSYAYMDFMGPYSKTFPVFAEVYKKLKNAGIENTVGIGLYHDDPAKVPADQLRSSCGSVIDESDIEKAGEIGLKTGKIDAKDSIVVEFPVKSSITYMIAPSKCYPVLTKYAKDNGYQMMAPFEVYDMPNKRMYIVMEKIKD